MRRTATLCARIAAIVAASVVSGCGGTDEGGSAEQAPIVASAEHREPASEPSTEPVPSSASSESPRLDFGFHDVVVLPIHEAALLRSEQRLLDVIVERMRMRRMDAVRREPTAEEAAYARSLLSESRAEENEDATPPASLEGAAVALFLRFPANRELPNGDLATRGIGGILALRRGERAPYLTVRFGDSVGWRMADEQIWPWLISAVRAEAAR